MSELARSLRPYYRQFRDHADDRIYLTGHSHQFWPEASWDGHRQAWEDAARWAGDKWRVVFSELMPQCQELLAPRIGVDSPEHIVFGANTHELGYRLASAYEARGPVVTTDAEFHSLSRQLDRLAESGLSLVKVPYHPQAGFKDRFIEALRRVRPAWAALSAVAFATAHRTAGLEAILAEAAALATPILVDAYHATNCTRLSFTQPSGEVYVTGGGYKYLQAGEGACFLSLPPSALALRPRYTGWFAAFSELDDGASSGIRYASGAQRFMGATFDPTGLYRLRAVLRWMDSVGLTPAVLEGEYQRQTDLIVALFLESPLKDRGWTLCSPAQASERGGFVSLRAPKAAEVEAALRNHGVIVDRRGDLLRFGPAPYIDDQEITSAMHTLVKLAAEIDR